MRSDSASDAVRMAFCRVSDDRDVDCEAMVCFEDRERLDSASSVSACSSRRSLSVVRSERNSASVLLCERID